MVNLFDIMRQSQHGGGYDNLARQFGLSVADTQRAAEALLPAFSLGLQRTGTSPDSFAGLLRMMTSGRYAPFYDGPFAGFWPQAQASGNDVLGQLFGSPDIIRRVADQAAAASGVNGAVMQQMMPVLAAMLMGGLFRFADVEGFADFLRQWANWLTIAKLSSPPPRRAARGDASNPFAPWVDMMGAFLKGAQPAPAAAKSAAPKSAGSSPARPMSAGRASTGLSVLNGAAVRSPAQPPGPGGDVWTEMVRAWLAAQAPEPPPPPPPPPPAQPNPLETLASLFQTGRDVHAQQVASFQSAMETLWGAGRAR